MEAVVWRHHQPGPIQLTGFSQQFHYATDLIVQNVEENKYFKNINTYMYKYIDFWGSKEEKIIKRKSLFSCTKKIIPLNMHARKAK